MRKYYYITTFIILMLVSFIGITYSYEYENSDSIKFELIGPSTLYVDVNTDYVEYGVKIKYKNMDISDQVIIDDSQVNMAVLGKYLVKYTVSIDGLSEYIYREVIVIDKTSPVIELVGGEDISIIINGSYNEYGYSVSDNYDDDLDDKVKVSGEVDTSKEGTYLISYTVVDSSGNEGVTVRKVKVMEPIIRLDSNLSGIVNSNEINVSKHSNTIVKNSFNENGIYYEGYVKDKSEVYKIKLKNKNNSLEYTYNMTVSKSNYYSGELDLTMVDNGEYDVYVVAKNEERLLNKLNIFSKIVRAKVGNKLVSVKYSDDMVSLVIEKFSYQYDIVIDPGHGGSDIGASNGIVNEKDLNLKVSKYEMCRYQSMGYIVHMIRENDTYGEMLGNSNIDQLDRRALTIGYYGAVSRVVYSNHHNGSVRLGDYGFEILVGNQTSKKDLILELSLYNKFKDFYGITDNNIRIYARDYDSGRTNDKSNGSIYNDVNYYAVIRIPYELFNVKNVIYEPIYLTNASDFNWYYVNENWIKVSEMKIQEYVNFLGGTYNSDNKKCL